MVHGTWYMVHGTWYMVHGTWYMVLILVLERILGGGVHRGSTTGKFPHSASLAGWPGGGGGARVMGMELVGADLLGVELGLWEWS